MKSQEIKGTLEAIKQSGELIDGATITPSSLSALIEPYLNLSEK